MPKNIYKNNTSGMIKSIQIGYFNHTTILYTIFITREFGGCIMERTKNSTVFKLVATALMAALCYVSFTYLKIPIPTISGDMTALHIGNAFCVLAALLLGGVYGGVAGSLGMTIADVLDPVYITSAPKTFILKLLIGLIAGAVAHRAAHITENHDTKYIIKWTAISSICGLGFNVIFDPILGYLYKVYILGINAQASKIMSTWAAGTTLINALVSTFLIVIIYTALRPVLIKAGLFVKVG